VSATLPHLSPAFMNPRFFPRRLICQVSPAVPPFHLARWMPGSWIPGECFAHYRPQLLLCSPCPSGFLLFPSQNFRPRKPPRVPEQWLEEGRGFLQVVPPSPRDAPFREPFLPPHTLSDRKGPALKLTTLHIDFSLASTARTVSPRACFPPLFYYVPPPD